MKSKENIKPQAFPLSENERKALKIAAARKGITIGQFGRQILRKALSKEIAELDK